MIKEGGDEGTAKTSEEGEKNKEKKNRSICVLTRAIKPT